MSAKGKGQGDCALLLSTFCTLLRLPFLILVCPSLSTNAKLGPEKLMKLIQGDTTSQWMKQNAQPRQDSISVSTNLAGRR